MTFALSFLEWCNRSLFQFTDNDNSESKADFSTYTQLNPELERAQIFLIIRFVSAFNKQVHQSSIKGVVSGLTI